jgi:Tetratricopeptide repeat/NB-ARC domain
VPESDLGRCITSVLALDQDLDATTIAEALWLAATTPATGTSGHRSHPRHIRNADRRGDTGSPGQQQGVQAETPEPRDQGEFPEQSSDNVPELAGLVPGRRIQIRRAKTSAGPLDITRSLRPFKRRWPDGLRLRLDIDATVRSYARTWQLVPQFQPEPERWFEADLAIDDSPTMRVWDEVVGGFSALLRQTGAFRNIRTWQMSVAGPAPLLLGEGGRPAAPGRLRTPGGRRLIIVVTDAAAAGWFRPGTWHTLRMWAESTPTALISPLDTRLWHRTGLDLPAIRVRPGTPGSPNSLLPYSVPYLLRERQLSASGWMPLPVATFSPHMLGRWARTLMRGDPAGCDALLIPPAHRLHHSETEGEDEYRQTTGRELADAFCRAATPQAARLAVLCAPFSAVTLPLLQFICQELAPEASTRDVSEVIVGGLFRSPSTGPGGAKLRFRPGVRTRLRELLTESDAWRTYEALNRHIIARVSTASVFAAGIPDPLGDIALPTDLRPFAAASREALEFLGEAPARWHEHDLISITPEPSGRADYAIRGGLPPRNVNFTGRDEQLARLRQQQSPAAAVILPHALQGMGGVGKTQIAIEYAHRYRSDYDLIWWVQADQRALVSQSLADLAGRLRLAASGTADTEEAAAAALDALRQGVPYGRWLLIFDNADQPEDLSDLLPRGPGDVLITSRNHRWQSVNEAVSVDVFTRAESMAYLTGRTGGRISAAEADQIASEMGDLPLALAQASAVLDTGISVADYLTRLREAVARIMATGKAPDYPLSMTAAWETSITTLREKFPQARDLLYCLAFFAPEPVPRDLFYNTQAASLRISYLLAAPALLDRAIGDLGRLALARTDDNTFTVHRLIHALIREELSAEEQESYRHDAHLLLASAAPGSPADPTTWPRYRELIPHALTVGLESCQVKSVRAFALDTLHYLNLSGDLDSCRAFAERLTAQWAQDSGDSDPAVIAGKLQLIDVLRQLGLHRESFGIIEETLEIAHRALGDHHPHTLALRKFLGANLRTGGDFPGARTLDRETLRLHQAVFGQSDPRTLNALSNLGLDFGLVNDYSTARNMEQEVLESQSNAADVQPDEILTTWGRLAWAARLGGDYTEAVDISKDAWDYGRERLGSRHYATLGAANAFTVALRRTELRDRERSLAIARQVLEQCTRAFGDHHPLTMAASISLSNFLRTTGYLDEALALAETTSDAFAAVYGEEHPYHHGSLGNLAVLWRATGQIDRARRLNETAFAGLESQLGPDNLNALIVAINIASDLKNFGEYTQACTLGESTLTRLRNVMGSDHPVTLGCAANLALDRRAVGASEEADDLLADTLGRYRRTLGTDHPDVVCAEAGRRLDFDFDPPPT